MDLETNEFLYLSAMIVVPIVLSVLVKAKLEALPKNKRNLHFGLALLQIVILLGFLWFYGLSISHPLIIAALAISFFNLQVLFRCPKCGVFRHRTSFACRNCGEKFPSPWG